jgi:hypothetical protein
LAADQAFEPRVRRAQPAIAAASYVDTGPGTLSKKTISKFSRPGNRPSDVNNNYAVASFIQSHSNIQSSIERVEADERPAYCSPILNGGSLPGGVLSSAIASIMATMT